LIGIDTERRPARRSALSAAGSGTTWRSETRLADAGMPT
jgi:hypothetical protein